MQYPLAIKILCIALFYTFLSLSVFAANPERLPMADRDPFGLEKEETDAELEITHKPSEKESNQIEKEPSRLVKVAHSHVMDLLHLSLVPKTMHLPNYRPFLQDVGIKVNWFGWLRNLWDSEQQSYGGGIDLHSIGSIQLSIDGGYQAYQLKEKDYNNSEGYYGLVTLLYVMQHNPLTNAYGGIAYGMSRFHLTTFNDPLTAKNQPRIAGWMQLVVGSEYRLVAQLYGGMRFGGAYLLHYTQNNNDPQVLNYCVPGYGRIVNKIMPDVTFYLKWSISFVEKKIVI